MSIDNNAGPPILVGPEQSREDASMISAPHMNSHLGKRARAPTFGEFNDSKRQRTHDIGEDSLSAKRSLTNNDGSARPQFTTNMSDEALLEEYEKMRIKYEPEGVSQNSLILLRRTSKQQHEEDPSLIGLPILKEMIQICNKLFLNDLEILVWNIQLSTRTIP